MAKKPEAKPAAKAAPVKPTPDPRVAKKPQAESFSNGRQDRVVYTHERNREGQA